MIPVDPPDRHPLGGPIESATSGLAGGPTGGSAGAPAGGPRDASTGARVDDATGRSAGRSAKLTLAAAALVLALGAAAAGSPRPTTSSVPDANVLTPDASRDANQLSALQLAEWLRARKPDLRVIDIRPDSEFEQFHITNAEHVALASLDSIHPSDTHTLVLYSGDGPVAAHAAARLRALGHRNVHVLHGGLGEWIDSVMSPVRTGGRLTDSAWDHQAALSRYFGGVPRLGDAQDPAARAGAPTTTAAATARIIRRGC